MFKKLISSLAVTLFIVIGAANIALSYYDDGYYIIYMTDSYGSTVEKTTFAWNETPVLYMHLASPGYADHTHIDLTAPDGTYWSGCFDCSGSAGQDFWLPLSAGMFGLPAPKDKTWDDIKASGVWIVSQVFYHSSTGGGGGPAYNVASFTISASTPDISGCINLKGSPLVNSKVILKQVGEVNQKTTTDNSGCYQFPSAVSGKGFKVIINGTVPFPTSTPAFLP